MTSFLIISKNNKQRQTTTEELCDKWAIHPFDITLLTKDSIIKNLKSIGLEDIKQIQKKIFLKPIKSKTKAIVIENAELLTTEAQNALLKVLEEPPDNTLIILSAETKGAFLSTILSRCQIIEVTTENKKLSDTEQQALQEIIETLNEWGIGKRLKLAETLAKDKDKAILWIENLILATREQLLTNVTASQNSSIFNSQFSTLNSFQSLHTLLKTTNVNPRFAIEIILIKMYNIST